MHTEIGTGFAVLLIYPRKNGRADPAGANRNGRQNQGSDLL